jgi:hypothetical protein
MIAAAASKNPRLSRSADDAVTEPSYSGVTLRDTEEAGDAPPAAEMTTGRTRSPRITIGSSAST